MANNSLDKYSAVLHACKRAIPLFWHARVVRNWSLTMIQTDIMLRSLTQQSFTFHQQKGTICGIVLQSYPLSVGSLTLESRKHCTKLDKRWGTSHISLSKETSQLLSFYAKHKTVARPLKLYHVTVVQKALSAHRQRETLSLFHKAYVFFSPRSFGG